MEIIVLCGIPASGKSTFYEKKLKNSFEIISLDYLKDRANELRVIKACLSENKSFVIDNTNVSKEDRERYIDIARKKHISITCCFFKPDVKKSITRNKSRKFNGGRFVPEQVIYIMNNKFEIPSYDEGFNDIYIIEEDYNEYKAVRLKSTSYIENINQNRYNIVYEDDKLKSSIKSNKERDGVAYVLANKVDDRIFIGTRKDISSNEELLVDIIKRNNGSNQLSEYIKQIGKENLYIRHTEKFNVLGDIGKKILIGKLLKEFGGKAMVDYQQRYIELYEDSIKSVGSKIENSSSDISKEMYMIYVLANKINSKIYVGSRKKYIKESDLLPDILSKNSGKNALALAIKNIGKENFYIKNIKYINCSKEDLIAEIGKVLIENGSDCLVKYQAQYIEVVQS